MTVDTEKYLDFVAGVTSFPSSDLPALLARASELDIENDSELLLSLDVTASTNSVYFSKSTVIRI